MTGLLAGKTALVTGGAKRLGRATALGLAQRGADVVVHYRSSRDEAERTAEEIRALGVEAHLLQADLGDVDAARSVMRTAIEVAGSLDILLNCASIYPADRLDEVTPESLDENLRVNAWAPLALSQTFAAQGVEGSIVNFLDTRMLDYDADHVSYHLSKRMLYSITQFMAMDYAPRIRVNAVAPGLVLAPVGKSDEYLRELAHTNPLERHGEEEDVVRAVLFLLDSPFVTGQVIYVDGGRNLKGGLYG